MNKHTYSKRAHLYFGPMVRVFDEPALIESEHPWVVGQHLALVGDLDDDGHLALTDEVLQNVPSDDDVHVVEAIHQDQDLALAQLDHPEELNQLDLPQRKLVHLGICSDDVLGQLALPNEGLQLL